MSRKDVDNQFKRIEGILPKKRTHSTRYRKEVQIGKRIAILLKASQDSLQRAWETAYANEYHLLAKELGIMRDRVMELKEEFEK